MKLLDTDICIQVLNGREPKLIAHFRSHSPAELALCSIVRAELLWGAGRSARVAENLERVRLFAEPLQSLPFDDACADAYGSIRNHLADLGTPIGPNDLFIAATALAFGCILVTRNAREFKRVPELRVETW